LGSFEKWLMDYIVRGGPVFGDYDPVWPDMPRTLELHENYMSWCQANKKGQYDIITETLFGTRLGEIFEKERKVEDGRRATRVYWGSEYEALKSFCKKCGLDIKHLLKNCDWYQENTRAHNDLPAK
jgi:hypothetical protein